MGRDYLVFTLELAAAAILTRKIVSVLREPLSPNTLSILYDERRNCVIYIFDGNSPHMDLIGAWRPPLPWTKLFTLPKQVLDPEVGHLSELIVDGVEMKDEWATTSSDMNSLSFTIAVRYFIPRSELNRYLAIIGPQPPGVTMGEIAKQIILDLTRKVAVVNLLSAPTREEQFDPAFREALTRRLWLDCSVVALQIDVVQVADQGQQ